jgi:hypothetical protein
MMKKGLLRAIGMLMLATTFSPARAAIQYTNIPDATLTAGNDIAINFDGLGVAEFTMTNGPSVMFDVDHHFVTVSEAEWDVIKGLPAGTPINATSGWFDFGDAYVDPGWETTHFPSGVDTYIGAQFKIGSNTYYGWIRVNWTGGVFVVKDFAYNNTPNTAINAGDMGGTTSVAVSSISVQGIGGATSVGVGNTLQMSATVLPVNATNPIVTWSVLAGSGTATIGTTGLLSGGTAGTVTVRATATDGSGVFGSQIVTIMPSLGMDESQHVGVEIYPNPTSSILYMHLDNGQQIERIAVYGLTGKLELGKYIQQAEGMLDLSGLAKGVYVMVLHTEMGKTISRKIIKE